MAARERENAAACLARAELYERTAVEIERLQVNAADGRVNSVDPAQRLATSRTIAPAKTRSLRDRFLTQARRRGYTMRSFADAEPKESATYVSLALAGKKAASLRLRQKALELLGWPLTDWPKIS